MAALTLDPEVRDHPGIMLLPADAVLQPESRLFWTTRSRYLSKNLSGRVMLSHPRRVATTARDIVINQLVRPAQGLSGRRWPAQPATRVSPRPHNGSEDQGVRAQQHVSSHSAFLRTAITPRPPA